jgi:hypothetical protein
MMPGIEMGWRTGTKSLLVVLLGGVLACLAGAARAADISPPAAEARPMPTLQSWTFQITPYVWASSISGHTAPFRRGPTIKVDKSFHDVLEDLNFGAFVTARARRERFVLSADLMYVDTTGSKIVNGIPVLGTASASIDTTEITSTLRVGYRFVDMPDFSLDASVGARVWHISNHVSVRAGPYAGSYGESFGWADPVIGVRALVRFTSNLSLLAQADAGGFGVGARSTWQALATLNYAITTDLALSAGYRVLKVDYRSDGHVFDTTLQGPLLGMTYRF